MTSEEIKTNRDSEEADHFGFVLIGRWLKEIAYQLAVMNENKSLELQRQPEILNGDR